MTDQWKARQERIVHAQTHAADCCCYLCIISQLKARALKAEERVRSIMETHEEACAALAVEVNLREAAEERVRELDVECERLKADHHALGRWPDCPRCLQFFRDDENGAVLNGRLEDRVRHLTEALRKARQYVQAVHAQIAAAMGHENTIVKPDLDLIDAALSTHEDRASQPAKEEEPDPDRYDGNSW